MSELSEIKALLRDQSEAHKEQSDKLNDIHFAIFGNRQAGVKGMAQIQSEHAKKLAQYDRFKWIATGATAGGWTGLVVWIKNTLGI